MCEKVCGLVKNRHGFLLGISDTVKVNFRRASVLMPENPLDRSDGDVAVFHDGGSRVSNGMVPEIPNSGLCTQSPHDPLAFLVRTYTLLPRLTTPVGVPEDPGTGETVDKASWGCPTINDLRWARPALCAPL